MRRFVVGVTVALFVVTGLSTKASMAGAAVPRADALGGSGQQSIVAITKSGAGYVAVGSDQPRGQTYARPVVWTAGSRGNHWTRAGHLASSAAAVPYLHGIAAASNGTEVAVGSVLDESNPKPGCCGGEPGFFVSTDGAKTFDRTTDVQTVQPPTGSTTYSLVEVSAITVSDDGTFVAVGDASYADASPVYGRPLAWRSTDDGQSWQVVDLPIDAGAGGVPSAITHDSEGFLAVGTEYPSQGGIDQSEPVVWRSTDGTDWTATTVPANGGASGIVSSDVGIVVVGTTNQKVDGVLQNCGGTMWFSNDDGATWSPTDRDPTFLLFGVGLAADSTYIAVGATCDNTSPRRRAIGYSSSNGLHWDVLKTAKSAKDGEMLAVAPFGKTGQLIVGDLGGHGFYWTGS